MTEFAFYFSIAKNHCKMIIRHQYGTVSSRLARDETQICETSLARLWCESLAKKNYLKMGKKWLFSVIFEVKKPQFDVIFQFVTSIQLITNTSLFEKSCTLCILKKKFVKTITTCSNLSNNCSVYNRSMQDCNFSLLFDQIAIFQPFLFEPV